MKKSRFALFQSVIALILCFSMLVGTTFAWLSDSVSSGKNMIAVGNLNVELDYLVGDKWIPVDETTAVLDENALWEPGRTEVAYLRIANAGSLALKYAFGVGILSETGSVNANGEEFKLSDHILFGLAESENPIPAYSSSAEARGALANVVPVSTGFSTGHTLEKNGDVRYVALVVYMPEDVGNVANYATGQNPPQISLGIELIATQAEFESDTFGNDYDMEAVAMLPGSSDGNITNPAKPYGFVIGDLLKVTIPANTLQNPGKVNVEIKETDTPDGFIVQADKMSIAYEISIEGAPNDGSVIYSVELFAGKNLDAVDVYHKGILIPDTHYDPVTGIVSFKTSSFSPFVVVYDKPVYTVSWDTDGDGNVDDTTEVAYGVVPTHAPGSKPSTTEQSYTFVYWTPEVKPVTGNITYTATFSEDTRTYTIEWKDGDKIVDEQQLPYNAIPVYQGETLTKQCHTLSWSSEIVPVTGNATYTAVWTAEHAWSDATCTAPKTCSVCGTEVGAAAGHTEEVVAGKPATCTETGLTEGKKCSICGVTTDEQTVIPANGHTEETIAGKPATCTEDGMTEGKKCTVCGETTVAQQTINAKGHTEETIAGKPATCTEDGLTDGKKCTVCGETTVAQQTINAKGHTEETVKGTAATCTEDGLTDGMKCSVCGVTTVAQQTITAKGHTEETIAGKPATCTETGLTDGMKCSICGVTTDEQTVIPANGHTDEDKNFICDICKDDLCTNHVEDTIPGKAATCTESGLTEGKKCSICGRITVAQQTINAKGHTEETVKGFAATCTESGLTEGKKCSICGVTTDEQTVIPANGHTEETIAGKPATCTEDGMTEGKKCTVCGETTVAQQTINAKGHTEEIVKGFAATCTEDGKYDGKKCSICGVTTVEQTVIPANGHTEETIAGKPATCTEDGLTDGKKCSVCGVTTIAQQTITAKGHTEEIIPEKAATCITGLTEGKKCSACGETIVAQVIIPAIDPHTDEIADNRCDVCGGDVYNITFHVGVNTTRVDTLSLGDEINYHEDEMKKYDGWIGWSDTENGNVVEALPETMPAENLTFYAVFNTQELTDKFDTVLPAAKFTYRVGNQNTVALSSLFKAIDGAEIGNDVDVTVAAEKVSVTGTYTKNDDDWAKGTIQFEGTGFVNVTIQENEISNPYTLKLEVVNATNATTATSAKSNNVVLLNDVGLSTIEVSGGHTLYGNNFKMTATSDPMYDTMRAGFVTLDNGTLDNVQIICPNFSYSIIYNDQIRNSENTAKPSDSSNEARGNVRSAVMATGNSKIVNSKVHGGRAAIFLRSGNLVINGSTISGGAAANIHALAAQSLTLRNVTLVQKPYKDNVHGTGKTIMGFSGLFECGADGNSTPLILEGTLVQNAWVKESYKQYAPSVTSSILTNAMSKTDFLHDLDGDGKNESLNLGFTYIPEDTGGKTIVSVTDNRTNKAAVPYEAVEVLAGAKVYSYKNTNGTDDVFTVDEDQYVSGGQGAAAPDVTFTDANADCMFETEFDANDGRWESTLTVNLVEKYDFSFDKLLVQKHGENLTYTVKTAEGTVVDTDKAIALTASGVTEYELTVTDGDATHTIYFILTATKSSIPEPEVVDTTGGTPLLVVKSKNSDWSCALPALEGIKVMYYTSANNAVTLDLATLTPDSTGKQNDTNNYWEITKDGYKLKVTCGVIHDTKNVYGMPVVVDNNGNKLYFTISNTNGYVSTNTAARSVKITYEFTDPNGKTLTFTKNYYVKYADYKDVAQYSYSDFVDGKLTDLLTSSSGGGSCVTPDTLITLANGKQVRVDSLTGREELLVWNLETGKYDTAPIVFVDTDEEMEYEIIHLYFSDGSDVKVISEHGFFNLDLGEYVYIDASNYADYIGHRFITVGNIKSNRWNVVTLDDVSIETEVTTAWSPVTFEHLCYYTNGVLSMPGGIEGLFNIFDVDTDIMAYDKVKMQKDIETYGLFTIDDFGGMITEDAFNAFNGAYLKVAIGKGNLTWEDIAYMAERYIPLM